ncbi:uncharacterized protein LOC110880573 [Helianthus annuus]|uniref:uncharacterized protein LOC110880573 n=1 Tax=Helianthus annuus TaxID=4232 RepID=UPI000B90115B|nr:uncharacterized protein LOC110880573 [Helianthus annuus]
MANHSYEKMSIYLPPNDYEDDFSTDSSLLYFVEKLEELEAEDTAMSSVVPKKIVKRDRVQGNENFMNDNFVDEPKYDNETFCYRFRIFLQLFLRIVGDIEAQYPWFQEGYDRQYKKSFTAIQKVTSAIKQLVTDNTPNENDEYLQMAERTSRECL